MDTTPEALPKWLTTREVADLYRVSSKTIYRWTEAGKLNGVRTPSGYYRFRVEELPGL